MTATLDVHRIGRGGSKARRRRRRVGRPAWSIGLGREGIHHIRGPDGAEVA